MKQSDLQEFLQFFIHNKNLTRIQQRKRNELFVRDYYSGINYLFAHDDIENMEYKLFHDPFTVVSFLHQFTESKSLALKYTTHIWDKDVKKSDYPYKTFTDFKKAYLEILNCKDGRPLNSIKSLCEHLWQTVRNFLVDDDGRYYWSEYKLRIGYNNYLKLWMDKNPGFQPASMPLSEFPEEIQPTGLINGKTLVYFGEVIDVFKRCIEFRDDDLYFSILRRFKESPDHIIDKELLKSLRGRSIYTDTEMINDALSIIAHNIFQRSEYPELKIGCELLDVDGREAIQLKILQVGSFSYRDINDSKIIANGGDGDISRIISKIKNLCDFSIESIFRDKNEPKPYRINYLVAKGKDSKRIVELSEDECPGFAYILTFYSYKA